VVLAARCIEVAAELGGPAKTSAVACDLADLASQEAMATLEAFDHTRHRIRRRAGPPARRTPRSANARHRRS